jgi:hypothetical protein
VGRNVGGARVFYVSNPRLSCEGGIRIDADSMVSFEATGFNQLMGNVYFEDEARRLISNNARYFDQVSRLEAEGDVELTDRASGNVVNGQNLLYLRAIEGRRQEELTVWGGRATARLYPSNPNRRDDPDAPPEGGAEGGDVAPYDVVADRIFLRGETYVQATGQVEAVRDSLTALGDTLRYDQGRERILLTSQARLVQDRFDLAGDEIFIDLPGDTIRLIEARGHGRLLGEDLDLDAPFIHMDFTAGTLDGLKATPLRPAQEFRMIVGLRILPEELDEEALKRPEATSETFFITADSLDVRSPGEVLERMTAVGRARAVSSARDSLNTPDTPDVIRDDWMIGDTVTAIFVSQPLASNPDSTEYVLRTLEAQGSAASLYRMASDSTASTAGPESDTAPLGDAEPEGGAGGMAGDAVAASQADSISPPADSVPPGGDATDAVDATGDDGSAVIRPGPLPAIHYVTASRILIEFVDGQVDRMEVTGLKQGVHLDPSGNRRGGVVARGPGGSGPPSTSPPASPPPGGTP